MPPSFLFSGSLKVNVDPEVKRTGRVSRFATLAIIVLIVAPKAQAACFPLPDAVSDLQKAGAGKASLARFEGDQAQRMIQRLAPDAGSDFDILVLVPRKDGNALVLLGSAVRDKLCVGEPEHVVNGADVVDLSP